MRKALTLCVVLIVISSLFAGTAFSAEDGKALFEAKCAMCHGKDGVAKAMAKGSGNFNDPKWQEANSAATIEKTIAEGKNKMTPFKGKLTPEQISAIAAHVKTLK